MEIWIKHNINNTLINAWRSETSLGAYAYNLFGNQISFTADSIVYTNYTYRPDGLRHSIGDKVHVWDSANIVADVDDGDVTVYVRGINLIYADDGDKTYYHFNAHGDVVVLTNSNGSKTKSYSYNAFGVECNEATLDDNPFRYCGEYYDKETQTIYLRARYYNPAQGRFTQQDGWAYANPQDPLSLNLYTYCWNNPIKYEDANGHCIDAISKKSLNDGGVGGGGAILLPVTQVIEKIVEVADDAGAAIDNFLTNAWSAAVNFCATQIDNIARIAADGRQAIENTIEKLAQEFNNNTTNPPDPNNWNHRDYYMNQAENEKLKRIIDQLYREDAVIGDGGTADMLRYEYKNGLELEHLKKATDRINELHKLIKSNVLSDSDLKLAYRLLDDLHSAVKMVKGG